MEESACAPDDKSVDLADDAYAWLTNSQFAQVVFLDVAESYPNDCDLRCAFAISGPVEAAPGDRIGIYRVPHVSPRDFVTSMWVSEGDKIVVFKAPSLPKEEDFYQFQYLRRDYQVLGASVPFTLHSPQTRKLHTVEDNEDEFLIVKSLSDDEQEGNETNEQDLEKKYTSLLSVTEKLTEDLTEKSESFMVLKEQYKSLEVERAHYLQLKGDLAIALEAKAEAEKKLGKALDDLDKMTGKMEQALKDKMDEHTERELLKNELERLQNKGKEYLKKLEESADMISAMVKSKDMAVQEIRMHVVRQDASLKEIDALRRDLEQKKEELTREKEAGKSMKRLLQEAVEALHWERDGWKLQKAKVEAAFQKEKEEMELKIETLSEELREVRPESKSSDAGNGSALATEPDKSKAENSNSLGQVGTDQFQVDTDQFQVGTDDQFLQLDKRLRDLEREMRTFDESHSSELKTIKDDIDMIRSTYSYASSAPSSANNLDSMVIQTAMLDQMEAGSKPPLPGMSTPRVPQPSGSPILGGAAIMLSEDSLAQDTNCSRSDGPTAEEQTETVEIESEKGPVMDESQKVAFRQELDGLVNQNLQKGQIWHLVSADWYKQLRCYLGDKQGCTNDMSEWIPCPGPVDNSPILLSSGDDIRKDLTKDVDFKLVPADAWKKITGTFGITEGQKPIERHVIEYGLLVKVVEVEVYLMELQLVRQTDQDLLHPRIERTELSKIDTMAVAMKKIRKAFDLAEDQEFRLWDKYLDGDAYELFTYAEDKTVQEMELNRRQHVVVEVRNLDGTWPYKSTSVPSFSVQDDADSSSGVEMTEKLEGAKSMLPQEFALTDDGRPVALTDLGKKGGACGGGLAALSCPICDAKFQPNEVRQLELHVESHLLSDPQCPVCQKPFSKEEQQALEVHVQGHFDADDFSLLERPSSSSASDSELEDEEGPNSEEPPAEEQPQPSGAFGLGSLSFPVKKWILDFD